MVYKTYKEQKLVCKYIRQIFMRTLRAFTIPYGTSELTFKLPWERVTLLIPKKNETHVPKSELLKKAFSEPLIANCDRVGESLSNKKIGIAINDQTRPLPHADILPALLDYLLSKNADQRNIVFYISTGTHRALSQEEIEAVLPNGLSRKYHVICHDCDKAESLIHLGRTSCGTPIFINKLFYESDIKIVVGNIEPHHFMGFSGGVKTAAIGLAGRKTIETNHAMLPHPMAKMGIYLENPMRADVEEIGEKIGIDCAFNVVLNNSRELMNAFWGHPGLVMRAGIQSSLALCQMDIPASECQFDLVIASAGGHPKDINLYQSQKALTHACLFAKKDGVIILAAACADGAGSQQFVDFMRGKKNWNDVINAFTSMPFKIGPHKAYQLALQASAHTIILLSDLPAKDVQSYLLTPAQDIQTALKFATQHLSANPRVAILPFATHSMPLQLEK